ncbi:uncharacterized protein [Procambarus clarkii]|uniref:uncharacterized protein isoform X1 n=1 Tax=Procambarus clarkii TaxID=6728 RepID=UPI0037420424
MKKRQCSKRRKSMEKKNKQEREHNIEQEVTAVVLKHEEQKVIKEKKEATVVVVNVKKEKDEEKEESEEDKTGGRESPELPPQASDSPPPSTSTVPQEAVVAQLNQLQQTVVSHILQYQAGVMAQFQQLQQQMLSQLSSSTQPQVTITPHIKNERKRPASSMSNNNENQEDCGQVGEMQFKRKRTAFNEKQYKVLETTFEHNNFPEPIDQHCIALRIKTPYRSIKMWFQNRRASIRKRLPPKDRGAAPGDNKAGKNASDPDARWYCTLCPSTFIAKKFLESHKEAHERETLYCPHCNVGFTHKVLLDTHKISKCSSKTGVDLTHLEDDAMDISDICAKGNIEKDIKPTLTSQQSSPTPLQAALPLLLLQKLQKQQHHQSPSSPPPLIDSAVLSQLQDNPLIIKQQQQQLMQQLLLAQLHNAHKNKLSKVAIKEEQEDEQENDKQEGNDSEDDQREDDQEEENQAEDQMEEDQEDEKIQIQQLQLQLQQHIQQQHLQQQLLLQQQQQEAKEREEPKGSLTLGGLTIFPVPASRSEVAKIRVKEEIKEMAEEEKQPLTLQDQITAILQSHGLKSTWKTPVNIKTEPVDNTQTSKERESMQEQIEAILRHQEEQRRKLEKNNEDDVTDDTDLNNMKRHRRRTTVFNEVQLRTLYLHFTYCNFPDPSMFKIIGHLTKLEPQVIKIWFQNERSRQRKRATHILDEVNSKEKPYKCRDCGMSFAMLTFLVKHSMRHNGDTDQDTCVRTCPLCLQKWNKEVFASHLKTRHNVNLSLVDEKLGGALMCYLCEEKFTDQENLMIHKHKHLKDNYGDPPQCSECKTTFVNAICLEAHMETHRHHEWNYKCNLCGAIFHDKILLSSHRMGHGVPLAPVSTIDRSRSQLQHTSVRAIHARARKTVASVITSLNNSDNNEATSETDSTKSEYSVSCNTPVLSPSTTKASKSPASSVSTVVSPPMLTPPSTIITPSSLNNLSFTSPSGAVNYVKLIPVQLVPVNNSVTGQKTASFTTVSSGSITTPTTTFISVPVSLKGSSETNPILNYLLEGTSSPAILADGKLPPKKSKKKALPNLIPISQSSILPLKEKNAEGVQKSSLLIEKTKKAKEVKNGINVDSQNNGKLLDIHNNVKAKEKSISSINTTDLQKIVNENSDARDQLSIQGEHGTLQVAAKKRYVPILPMIPVQLAPQEPQATPQPPSSDTATPQRTRRSRNVPNKRLWESFDLVGYKRRKTPTYFTGNQREILEAHFEHDNFPEPGEQMAISIQLGVEYVVVKTWFQNTRKNYRKQLKEVAKFEDVGPFPCYKCSVSYITRESLNKHYEKHNTESSYSCGECGIYFSHPVVLNTHLMRHLTKAADGHKKKLGAEAPMLMASSQTEAPQTYEGDNESTSESDSNDEGNGERPAGKDFNLLSRARDDSMDDGMSEDFDDYHPIMAVECILDNSSEEEYETESMNESPIKNGGHKCSSCMESFASLIALKEHYPLKCINTKFLRKPGEWRRRKAKRKHRVGNEIRCIECHLIFPDRPSFLDHFNSSKCNAGRQRIEYTDEEQAILVTHYDRNNFPMPSEMSLLARRLGVRYRQIMHWFQNRRSKERKQQKESKYPPVECQECKVSFVTDSNLKRHNEVLHSQDSIPECEFVCLVPGCGAVFNNADLLVTHRMAHQVESDASQNDENVDDKTALHHGRIPLWKNFTVLEAHYNDNNFPDPMDIGFIARRLDVDPLNVHIWFKERRKQHIHKLEESKHEGLEGEAAISSQKAMSKMCSTCDAAFICQADLNKHQEMHKSHWAQACHFCGKEYSNSIVLETHWIRHGIKVELKNELNSDSKTGRPSGAPLTDTQLKVLETHYEHNNFPGTSEVWLVAKRLNLRPKRVKYWFQTKRGKDRRAQKMATTSTFVCSLCGAAFISELHLDNHKRLHRSSHRFPCTQCKAIFLSSILQVTHELNHDLISGSKTLFRKLPDGAKDPLTLGQAKPGDIVEKSDSDGSEPELEIDERVNMDDEIASAVNTITCSVESEGEAISDNLDIQAKISSDNFENKVIVVKSLENIDKDVVNYYETMEKELKYDLDELRDTQVVEGGTSCKDEMEVRLFSAVKVAESKSIITEEKKTRLPDKKVIREEVFFDDITDSEDDDDDEPRLKIVSAYTISPDTEDLELEDEEES